jgi:hypothetical protein
MMQRFEEKQRLFEERDGELNGAGGSELHAAPPMQPAYYSEKTEGSRTGAYYKLQE